MTVERHEITYSFTFTDQLIRDDIEYTAALEPFENLGSLMQAKVLACREWLAANPQGMTREEFNKLPNGTIVRRYGTECIKIGNQVARYGGKVFQLLDFSDHDLASTAVVSTPPQPTLDDVARVVDVETSVWERWGDDTWERLSGDPTILTTTELLAQQAPLTLLIRGPQIGGKS